MPEIFRGMRHLVHALDLQEHRVRAVDRVRLQPQRGPARQQTLRSAPPAAAEKERRLRRIRPERIQRPQQQARGMKPVDHRLHRHLIVRRHARRLLRGIGIAQQQLDPLIGARQEDDLRVAAPADRGLKGDLSHLVVKPARVGHVVRRQDERIRGAALRRPRIEILRPLRRHEQRQPLRVRSAQPVQVLQRNDPVMVRVQPRLLLRRKRRARFRREDRRPRLRHLRRRRRRAVIGRHRRPRRHRHQNPRHSPTVRHEPL